MAGSILAEAGVYRYHQGDYPWRAIIISRENHLPQRSNHSLPNEIVLELEMNPKCYLGQPSNLQLPQVGQSFLTVQCS